MAAAEHLELDDMQALILDGFVSRPHARYALLEILDPVEARQWLRSNVDRVATAQKRREDGKEGRLNLAFTFEGLRKLGLEPASGFLAPFREGMRTDGRALDLGDTNGSDPKHWAWGGGVLHVLLMQFSREGNLAADWSGLASGLQGWANEIMHIDAKLSRKEAFGFVDGISQPYIEGSNTSRRPSGAEARADTVKPGEFILGYLNEADTLPTTPTIAAEKDLGGHLPMRPTEPGRRDFGRNGTYLVLRQLQQDVLEFLRFLDQNAPGDRDEQERIAAKMVGRWQSGAPLVKAPDADREALSEDNAFGYHDTDPLGHACPLGAHIRRVNPRDSLVDAGRGITPAMALKQSRRHRLIRRGRLYGDDATGKGLMFLCLNANIQDQFEFVQHNWINSPRFGGLDGETDPLVGPREETGRCPMTIPSAAGKQRLEGLARFVEVKGGDYFFLPGIRALRCLAQLP